MIASAWRLDACGRRVVTFEVEAHRTVFVGGDRDEIAARSQARAAAAQVVGTQGNVIEVGLDVDNHPGTGTLMLAGHDDVLAAHGHCAVEVQTAGEVFIERGALNEDIAIDGVIAETREAGKTDAVGIGNRRGRYVLQHMVLQVLAIGKRGVVVTATVTGGASTNATRPLLARPAKCQADAQVDTSVTFVATAETAGAIEDREAPVGIAAEQVAALGPAEVNTNTFDISIAVGNTTVDRASAADPMIHR
ncbi:hypothetical protein D3C71_1046950 [compost metagenome]